MVDMKKRLLIVVLALFGGAAPVVLSTASTDARTTTTTTTTTTTATARVPTIGGTVVLGSTKTAVSPPVCPKGVQPVNCQIILERATGLETIRDGVAYPTTVKAAGTIVAFTLGVATLSNSAATTHMFIHDLDTAYGGVAMAAISVLKQPPRNRQHLWTVVSESPLFHLQPFLGYTVQFPLSTPLAVTPGEVVALTVPTWAPVISYQLPTKTFAYRQSRSTGCNHPGNGQNAQLTIGGAVDYVCRYSGARLEYSATEVLAAPPPKNYVHSTNH
jgi:hypothetical protein